MTVLLSVCALSHPAEWEGWTVQTAPAQALAQQVVGAAGLLIPHDGGPVRDVQGHPERWAQLALTAQAVRRGVPVLAWGTGAALLGRVLGAEVCPTPAHPEPLAAEYSRLPRTATAERWSGAVPLLWTTPEALAWAGVQLPGDIRRRFVELLRHPAAPRRPATPLEAIGGADALRPLLADFYARAQADPLLGPTFAAHVHDWPEHLERVLAFWITMLGGTAPAEPPAWKGNLNTIHAPLGVRRPQLERWLALFREATAAHLDPEQAAVLLQRAEAMGRRLGQQR